VEAQLSYSEYKLEVNQERVSLLTGCGGVVAVPVVKKMHGVFVHCVHDERPTDVSQTSPKQAFGFQAWNSVGATW
jgi:hypothetical protein